MVAGSRMRKSNLNKAINDALHKYIRTRVNEDSMVNILRTETNFHSPPSNLYYGDIEHGSLIYLPFPFTPFGRITSTVKSKNKTETFAIWARFGTEEGCSVANYIR